MNQILKDKSKNKFKLKKTKKSDPTKFISMVRTTPLARINFFGCKKNKR